MKTLFHKIGSRGLFFLVYCLVRFLVWRGRLTVQGWNHLCRLVEECDGRCIIVSNHPTLWEPLFIGALLRPWYRTDPTRRPRNVIAVDELDKYPPLARVIPWFAEAILVDRNRRASNVRMFLGVAHALRAHRPVIMCPEGRCTATPAARSFENDTTYPAQHAEGETYMLVPQDASLRFACREQVPLITARVSIGKDPWFMSTSHWREFCQIYACGMTIEFSDSLFVPHPATTVEEFAHAILHPTTSTNASRM